MLKSLFNTKCSILMSLIVIIICPSAMTEERIHVDDFGARGDGVADDGDAIRRALKTAMHAGKPTIIEFAKKTYRIGPRYDRWCAIALVDAHNITVDGREATLLFHPHNRAFLVYRSEGITIRNFTVDYDPLPFTQGDVIEINRERKELVLQIHDGFPLPDAGAGRHGAFIEKGGNRYTHHWFYIGNVRPISKEKRRYGISGSVKDRHEERALQTEVGQRFVFPVRYPLDEEVTDSRYVIGKDAHDRGVYHTNPAASFQIRFSKRCLLENITEYASPAMSFRLTGTQDVALRNIRITYKPDSGRLMVGCSDGFHCKNNKTGPIIENCLFEGLLDDSINISTMSEDVVEKISDTEFITHYSDIAWYDSSLAKGDRLLVYDPAKAVIIGEVNAVRVKFIGSHRRMLTIDEALPGIFDAKTIGRDRATRFYIKKTRPAVVRNCIFRSQMKTGMVLRTPVVCENNHVEETAYGVHAVNGPRWGEGPIPYDQTYRNNSFENCWIACIQLGRLGIGRPIEPAGGPILIENCSFTQGSGNGIGIYNLSKIKIQNSSFKIRPNADPKLRAISLRSCPDLVLRNCKIEDPRSNVEGAIRIRDTDLNKIRLENNTFLLPDEAKEIDVK